MKSWNGFKKFDEQTIKKIVTQYRNCNLATSLFNSHNLFQVVKAACQEVTTEHCVDVPIAVEKATPVETCHVVTKVDCAPQIHQIPKTVCEPATIETVEVPAPAPAIAYAFPGAVAPHVVAAPLAPAAVAAEPAAVAEA